MKITGKVITPVVFCASFGIATLEAQTGHSQGTTYISNLNGPPTNSIAVGSDCWVGEKFYTGPNVGGYVLDSVQFSMSDAVNYPSDFSVMVYSTSTSGQIKGSVATLNGDNPTSTGIYTYTPDSSLTLARDAVYYVIFTSGTSTANGAYELNVGSWFAYQGGWGDLIIGPGYYHSGDGSSWSFVLGGIPQFAVNATPVPEPSSLALFGLGGLFLLWRRRK